MRPSEAEAVKLFANTYLAMRVSFFNELDSFCDTNQLNPEQIITGIGHDSRIGNYYNNPSFGYGGYCLPKDTKQLLANYENIPNTLIKAIVESNKTRKDYIAKSVLKFKPKTVGIYRLVMKGNSDNFRYSAIQDIIKILKNKGIKIIIFEPNIKDSHYKNIKVIKDFKQFSNQSDLIISNRKSSQLNKSNKNIYTRDIFKSN